MIHVFVCRYICTDVGRHVQVRMYVFMHVCMPLCMHVCVYVRCMHPYMYKFSLVPNLTNVKSTFTKSVVQKPQGFLVFGNNVLF